MTYWKFWYFKVFRSREILEVSLGLFEGRKLATRETADHRPAALAAAVRAWVDARAVEVQVVGTETIAPRSRPIAPVGITAAN